MAWAIFLAAWGFSNAGEQGQASEPGFLASAVLLLAATAGFIGAVARRNDYLAWASTLTFLLVGAGPVVPWLLGDRLLEGVYVNQGWAFGPLLLFWISRTEALQISRVELWCWNALAALAIVVALFLTFFALVVCPQLQERVSPCWAAAGYAVMVAAIVAATRGWAHVRLQPADEQEA